NDSLEKAVRRSGWYKPVGNDDASSHKAGTICGSSPLLELNNIAFRISRIDDVEQATTVYLHASNLSDRSTAGCDDCLQRFIDIVHRKCDVREAALISSRQFAFDQLIVAEDLQSRSIVSITGQAQMNAAKVRVWNRVHFVEPRRTQVALWTFGFTTEHVAIESDQSFPISGDQIGVYVFGADWHSLFLR